MSDKPQPYVSVHDDNGAFLYATRWRDSDEAVIALARTRGVPLPEYVIIRRSDQPARRYRITAKGCEPAP